MIALVTCLVVVLIGNFAELKPVEVLNACIVILLIEIVVSRSVKKCPDCGYVIIEKHGAAVHCKRCGYRRW